MSDLPRLNETTIRSWTDAGSFQRGTGYYHQGRIYNPRRQGQQIKAQCQGSMPEPYRVEITLGPEGIASGHCSCPVGSGGHCKHSVALLLTWVHERETFTETETLASILQRRSKEALIALILRMVDHAPQLESLVEMEALVEQAEEDHIDAGPIQNRAWEALHSGRGDWQDGYYIADRLYDILNTLGTRAQDSEQWHNAATVYATVAKTILEEYGSVYDDEGDVISVVWECSRGLQTCLTNMDAAAEREEILNTLWTVYQWDTKMGGYGAGDDVPTIILGQATSQERQKVAQWVRKALSTTTSDWEKSAYGGLLLDLEADTLDDETYLRICRESGRLLDAVARLLELGRIEEALAEVQDASDYDVWRAADIFAAYNEDQRILPLMRERAKTGKDRRVKAWLKTYAEEHNKPEDVFRWTEDLFWEHPSVERYAELKSAAQTLGRWKETRKDILARLEEDNRRALIQIQLHEHEHGAALKTLSELKRAQERSYSHHYYLSNLYLTVAKAVAKTHPKEAIDLYIRKIHRLIDARGRGNYAQAAQHLLRVRNIYQRLGEDEAWHRVIRNLRTENSNLPAMQDEFNKAGLGGKP